MCSNRRGAVCPWLNAPRRFEHMDISVKTVEAHLTKGILRCGEYMDAEEVAEVHPIQPKANTATYTRGGHNG